MKAGLLFFTFFWLLIPQLTSAQLVEHPYRFYQNFDVAQPKCGPELTQAQALGTCNAPASPGGFVDDVLPCGVQRKVYHTNLNWGLRYPNAEGGITDTYTIQMYVKITDWGKTWARIIDFSDGRLDQGIYFKDQNGSDDKCINFYPSGNAGPCPYFNNNTYYFLTFTRNGQTNVVDVYVDNMLFTSYNDAQRLYVGRAGTPIYIFRDDASVPCESGSANFAYLSFTNKYSSQGEVNNIYSQICFVANVNTTADFSIDPKTSCVLSENIEVNYTGEIPDMGTDYTFEWDWDGATVVSGSGMGPFMINWATKGTKYVSLTITNKSCGNKIVNTKEITIASLDLTTTATSVTCSDDEATITVSPVEGLSPFEYSIDSVNFQTSEIFKVMPDSYQVFIKDANGCVASKDVTIEPAEVVTVQTIDDVTICMDEEIQLITTSNATSFSWSPALELDDDSIKDPVAKPSRTSQYIVTATKNNCSEKDTVNITVIPEITVIATPDSEVEAGIPFQLSASSPELSQSAGAIFTWLPPTGLDNASIANPVATLFSNAAYTVQISTIQGCSGSAQINLTVKALPSVVVPGIFTPDGDGNNEVLKVISEEITSLNYFRIYNRWGEVVFSSTDLNTGWDGTLNGNPQVAGVYVFRLEAVDEKGKIVARNGEILLVR